MYNGLGLADTDYHRVGSLENLNSVLRLIVKYSSGRRMHQKDSYKLAGNTWIPEYELSMAFSTHCLHTLITTICNKKKKSKGAALLHLVANIRKGHKADLSHISVEIILNCQT